MEPLSKLLSVYGVLEDEVDGFEKLPEALVGLLDGENRGRRLVKIS